MNERLFRIGKLSLGALLLASLAACSSYRVETDYAPGTDFTQERTYAWSKDPTAKTGDPRIDDNTLLHQRLRAAIDAELAARGFSRDDGGAATYRVRYQTVVEDKVRVSGSAPSYYPYGRVGYSRYGYGYDHGVQVRQYEEGTLIIDLLGSDDETIVWRGATSGAVRESSSPQQREERTREVVRAILEKFPPTP